MSHCGGPTKRTDIFWVKVLLHRNRQKNWYGCFTTNPIYGWTRTLALSAESLAPAWLPLTSASTCGAGTSWPYPLCWCCGATLPPVALMCCCWLLMLRWVIIRSLLISIGEALCRAAKRISQRQLLYRRTTFYTKQHIEKNLKKVPFMPFKKDHSGRNNIEILHLLQILIDIVCRWAIRYGKTLRLSPLGVTI